MPPSSRAVDEAFSGRRTAKASDKGAGQHLKIDRLAIQKEYVDFRETVREEFEDAAARTALGVNGRIARDTEKLITDARASYGVALKEAYLPVLGRVGFTEARLRANLDALTDLTGDVSASAEAEGEGIQATGALDQSLKDLLKWTVKFKHRARREFKNQPAILSKLEIYREPVRFPA